MEMPQPITCSGQEMLPQDNFNLQQFPATLSTPTLISRRRKAGTILTRLSFHSNTEEVPGFTELLVVQILCKWTQRQEHRQMDHNRPLSNPSNLNHSWYSRLISRYIISEARNVRMNLPVGRAILTRAYRPYITRKHAVTNISPKPSNPSKSLTHATCNT